MRNGVPGFKRVMAYKSNNFYLIRFVSMRPKVNFGNTGNSYSINPPATTYNATTNVAPAYTQNYALNNATTANNATYNAAATNLITGNAGARVNFGSGNTYGQTYTTHQTTPIYTNEVREVRQVPQVQEVRRVEHVVAAQPVATSQVQRVDHVQTSHVAHGEVIEEFERPRYNKIYSSPREEVRKNAPLTEEATKPNKCCGTPCWALLGLLGLIGVILGMLFGLGVIGGLSGPNLNLGGIGLPDINGPNIDLPDINGPNIDLPDINGPNIDLPDINGPNIDLPDINGPNIDLPDINGPNIDIDGPNVKIDGADYSGNVVTVDTQVLENGNAPNTDFMFPPVNGGPTSEPTQVDPIEYVQPVGVNPNVHAPIQTTVVDNTQIYVNPNVHAPVQTAPTVSEPVYVSPITQKPTASVEVRPTAVTPVAMTTVTTSSLQEVNPIVSQPISTFERRTNPESFEPVSIAPRH